MSNLILYPLDRVNPTEETYNSNTWPHIISLNGFQKRKEKLRQIKSQIAEEENLLWFTALLVSRQDVDIILLSTLQYNTATSPPANLADRPDTYQ